MRANFVLSGVAAGIRRNLSMTVALILSTSIALGFVGAALLANAEISKFKSTYQDKINVALYLCSSIDPQPPCKGPTTPAQRTAIETQLRSDSQVETFSYIDENQAYDLVKKQQPDAAKFVKKGVIPASYSVKLKDVRHDYDSFQSRYAAVAGVGKVFNQIDTIKTLLDLIDSVRILALAIAIVVLVASILLIANTIQVAAQQRRNETSIMRLVGASRWMTELPFMLETVIASLAGGLLAMLGIWIGKAYVLDSVFSGPTKRGVIPNLGINDVLVAGGTALILGVVLSALTAFGTLRLRVKL
jgi:cell division transport system permease protein